MLKPAPRLAVLVKRFPKLSETFILNELLGLEADGFAIDIFHLYPASDTVSHPETARLNARNVLLEPAGWRQCLDIARRRPFASLSAFRRLVFHERRGAPEAWRRAVTLAGTADRVDLFYAHFIDLPASIAEAASRLSGKPFAISAHAKDIYLTRPRSLQRKLEAAEVTTTCTAHNKAYLKAQAPAAAIAGIHHGVDPARLARPAELKPRERPLLLAIGRLRPKKGFDLLVEACTRLKAEGIAFDCEIIGYGPAQDELRTLIASRGLGDTVRLLGKTPHDEVVARLHQATIFVMPSRILADGDRDGVPNVVLEAMAASLPVVASNVSGLPEAVIDGETGLLVPSDDAGALTAAIISLLSNPARAAGMGKAGARRIAEFFTVERSAGAVARRLRAVAEAPNGRVGYVVKGYPRLSESFISNEIRILKTFGLPIEIYAIKKGDSLAAQALEDDERRLNYLPATTSLSNTPFAFWLARNAPTHLRAMAIVFLQRPRAFLATLGQAIAMGRRYRRAGTAFRKVFVKEFMQGAWIARGVMKAGDIRHLHGHFCHGAATVTWFASRLAGATFSFTAHAKDIYEAEQNPGDLLARKIAAARFVVTCTGANHEHLMGCGCKSARARLHTIYHGLDVAAFAPRPLAPMDDERPLVLAVGRHVAKKGFNVLIDACALLKARGAPFRCQIVGESGEATETLRAQIEELNLQADVTLEPPMPQDQLRARYAEATIFAMPCVVAASGDRDGIPNVLAEAMAMEIPVVSTPISGIAEIVVHDENGLLATPGDARALGRAIERLLGDAVLRRRLGVAARETIVEKFDSSKTTRRLFDLFEAALAESIAA